MYEKTNLNNGLSVITHYMPKRVSVSLGIWIKVGSRYEQAGISGISHFLEHLVFKGTGRRSCEQIKQSIEGVGGSLNAFTAEEYTCYLTKVHSKHLTLAFDVLWDMVLNANLAVEDIEMERKVILEEIRMYKDLPGYLAMEFLNGLLWPEHPLGRSIAGELSTVTSISRLQLQNYRQRFYRLDNIVIAACGNLRHKKFAQECRKYFSSPTQAQQDNPRVFPKKTKDRFAQFCLSQLRPQVKLHFKDTKQTHLALGVHGVARNHSSRFALGLLHIILGANMSSRLFREVRERRGLAYEIGTSLKFFRDSGAFIVHAGIDNRRAVEALEVILGQLEQVKKNKIKSQELKRAKEYYIGQLGLSLEDTSDHMLWLGESSSSLIRFLSADKIIQRVKAVDSDVLTGLANRILQNNKFNLSLVGPLTDKDKKHIQQRLLSF